MFKFYDGDIWKSWNNEVDPEVEAWEPDVELEVIVDKIGWMHELPNNLLDMYLLTQWCF